MRFVPILTRSNRLLILKRLVFARFRPGMDRNQHSPEVVEIVTQLVERQHMSVPERMTLPNGQAPFSLVVAVVMRIVEEAGGYPRGLDAQSDYSGGILIRSEKGFEIYWRAEYSMLRYRTYRVDSFTNLRDAAKAYVKGEWLEHGIDGVMIDLSG